VVLAYSVSGGILAGIYNDVLQGLIMAVASVLVFMRALDVTGGLSGLSHTLMRVAPEHLAPWGTLTPLAAMSYFFVFGMGTLGQPHVLHKFYMLRDPLKLRWFPVGMTLAMTLTLLLFVGVGLAMKALVATGATPPLANPDDATPAFLLRFAPEPLAGLVFTAAAAAIMSTVNSFLSVGAAALTRDLPRALGRPIANELQWGRRWTVALMLLATLVAVQPGVVVAFLGIFGWGLFASTLVPALTVGLNWEGATRAGAVASIATGLVATLVLETLAWLKWFTLPAGVTATAVTLVASLLVFLAVSHVTRAAHEPLAPDVAAVLRA
jgi:Na+/proline symporter